MTVDVYLTYVEEGKDISRLLHDLVRREARVTLITAPEGGAATMNVQEGMHFFCHPFSSHFRLLCEHKHMPVLYLSDKS